VVLCFSFLASATKSKNKTFGWQKIYKSSRIKGSRFQHKVSCNGRTIFFDIGEFAKMLETFQSSSTHIEWIGEWG
jgi:hypothetical protein